MGAAPDAIEQYAAYAFLTLIGLKLVSRIRTGYKRLLELSDNSMSFAGGATATAGDGGGDLFANEDDGYCYSETAPYTYECTVTGTYAHPHTKSQHRQ